MMSLKSRHWPWSTNDPTMTTLQREKARRLAIAQIQTDLTRAQVALGNLAAAAKEDDIQWSIKQRDPTEVVNSSTNIARLSAARDLALSALLIVKGGTLR